MVQFCLLKIAQVKVFYAHIFVRFQLILFVFQFPGQRHLKFEIIYGDFVRFLHSIAHSELLSSPHLLPAQIPQFTETSQSSLRLNCSGKISQLDHYITLAFYKAVKDDFVLEKDATIVHIWPHKRLKNLLDCLQGRIDNCLLNLSQFSDFIRQLLHFVNLHHSLIFSDIIVADVVRIGHFLQNISFFVQFPLDIINWIICTLELF